MKEPQPKFKPTQLAEELKRCSAFSSDRINRVWVVGSLVHPDEEVTAESDIDIYIQFNSEEGVNQFSYTIHEENIRVELTDGRVLDLPIDVTTALTPGEIPKSARGRPVYELTVW